MKFKNEIFETKLNAHAVDECSRRTEEFLISLKVPKRIIVRHKLTVEEILLKMMDEGAEGAAVRFMTGKRYFSPFISLEIEGEAYNVYSQKNTEQSILGDSILRNLGLSPDYSYINDANVYGFRLKKKSLGPFATLLIALACAVVIGMAGLAVSENVRNGILDMLILPLHDTFLNILGCIAGPMVFLSVAWGIYGIGDAATLKKVGRKILSGYMGTVMVMAALVGVLCLPVFKLDFSSSIGGVSEASSVLEMILGIIPQNIFSPFIEGNTLQIIFLAVVIGIAMLFLGQKTDFVAVVVEQINYIVQFLIEIISKLVPYFIVLVIVKLMWSESAGTFLSVWKLFAVFIAAIMILVVCVVGYTSMRNRVSPALLVSKGLPTLLIAVTTASSAAAFGTNMKACRNEYGIDDKIASFGIPLGMVTFKPTTAINYIVMALFFAEMYETQASVPWYMICIFTASVLAIATPPIPGGAMTAYTVLFAQLGIPPEALAIALACDTLFDFLATGGDQFLLPMELLNQGSRMGLVDRNILTKGKRLK